ncbi:uncharacterized protein K02A2.6-like [Malaya genurostris]|uniref:uncharacterized protein K02A2.6-like n=1 Tax=Malaya genurostris TaxID=325434 RepID=UPI0026F3A7E0|nr:uncharacterized protein K02A2.6-like [Malaya genurostris]
MHHPDTIYFVDEHPLPSVEELFANVAGGEKFTKIDLSQAYLQLEVSADDQEILTFSTHLGLYRSTRLMYGISSAPAIWQRLMEEVLNGIPGVTVFLDDVRVTGLCKYNMRINLDKCQFFADRIEYCGYLIDRDGIHKVRSKIDAMQNMPVPENKDQVRSFVGLVNYYGRFFPHLSTTIYPLNRLLQNNVIFKWTKESNDAFLKVKEEMQSERFLVHYSTELPTKPLDNVVEEVDLLEVNIIETLSIRVEDLAKSTPLDSTVKILLQGLKNGKTVDARDRFGIDQIEFALQQGCIMRGKRVSVPPELRPNVLKELHSTNFGTKRLKSLARGYVWWERIDKEIEELVRNCASCQMTRPEAVKVPLHCWETPKEPFERVHVDFAGPFMVTYFIVFVDAYKK